MRRSEGSGRCCCCTIRRSTPPGRRQKRSHKACYLGAGQQCDGRREECGNRKNGDNNVCQWSSWKDHGGVAAVCSSKDLEQPGMFFTKNQINDTAKKLMRTSSNDVSVPSDNTTRRAIRIGGSGPFSELVLLFVPGIVVASSF